MASNNAIVAAATHYSFESDGSVALAGRLGSLWVYPDGVVYATSTVPGTAGFPAYTDPQYLLETQRCAAAYLTAAH